MMKHRKAPSRWSHKHNAPHCPATAHTHVASSAHPWAPLPCCQSANQTSRPPNRSNWILDTLYRLLWLPWLRLWAPALQTAARQVLLFQLLHGGTPLERPCLTLYASLDALSGDRVLQCRVRWEATGIQGPQLVSSCCWGAVTTQQEGRNSIASTRLIRTPHFRQRLRGEGVRRYEVSRCDGREQNST
jgi:hypothetical protein